jgi:hypothetical protein
MLEWASWTWAALFPPSLACVHRVEQEPGNTGAKEARAKRSPGHRDLSEAMRFCLKHLVVCAGGMGLV